MKIHVSKAVLVIVTVLITFGLSSCGGGGGGTPQLIPIPGGLLPSSAIDTPKVLAARQGNVGPANPLVLSGTAGAAMANAVVKAIDSNTIEAFTTAAPDGSFHFGSFPTGFNGVSGAVIKLAQTAPGFGESLTIQVTVM